LGGRKTKPVIGGIMRSLLLMILSILIIPTSTFAEVKGIKIIAEDWPPFSFKENESITGFSIEIIEQLFSDTGIEQDGKTEIWPWARSLKEIQKTPNILITSMNRNEERENSFKWVGPISPREIWLFKLASREDILLRSLEDAKSYQTGAGRKSSSADYLIKNGFIENKNLQLANIEIQNIKKLLLGRIDLVTFNIAEMAWHLRQLTPPATMQMVTPVFLMSGGSQYFIALSKQVPDSIILKLQKALDQIKQDGRYKKIWRKYME
jgi:polar amino acid transport system substrate-binding protein